MDPIEVRTQFEEGFAELRKRLSRLNPFDLPSVPIKGVSFDLPKVSCVYFVLACASRQEILYIGKAVNLKFRWLPNDSKGYHDCYLPALKLDCCRLAWWELDRVLTDIAERLLIDMRRPPWNVQGNPGSPGMPRISIEDLVSLGVKPTFREFRELADLHFHEISRFAGTQGEVKYEDFRHWIEWLRARKAGEPGCGGLLSQCDAAGLDAEVGDAAVVLPFGTQGDATGGPAGPAR